MSGLRLGFVGLGHITQHAHLAPLAERVEKGEVVFQAFCDVNEETASEQAKKWGARGVYTDYRAMFDAEDLDAVYLCIPPTLHTDVELIAAEKGIALFVEKPQTLDVQQAVAYRDAIQSSGIVAQVGFMSRYYPASEKVCELLEGRTARHAHVQLFYSGKHVRLWTSRMELCGGSFVENTIHMVDLLRYFLGDISAVSAFYHKRKPGEGPEPINMPHVYNVNYQFKSGVVANATTSRVLTQVAYQRRNVTVVADDAVIDWSTRSVSLNGEVVAEWADQPNAFALQAGAFIAAVKAGDPGAVRSPYAEALNSLTAVLGANLSAEKDGARVALADMVEGKAIWVPKEIT
jgi:myo-inositol 2-dehydrogenase / D-chiro-inositol 1-dehydrogenase